MVSEGCPDSKWLIQISYQGRMSRTSLVSVHTAETGKRRKQGSLRTTKSPAAFPLQLILTWLCGKSLCPVLREWESNFPHLDFRAGIQDSVLVSVALAWGCDRNLCFQQVLLNTWRSSAIPGTAFLHGVSWHAPHTAAPQGLSHSGCKTPAYLMAAGAFLLTWFLCPDRPLLLALSSYKVGIQLTDSSPFVCHCVRQQSLKQKRGSLSYGSRVM